MATPQSPDAMAAMVDQIAAKQMGVTPTQQAEPKAADAPKEESTQDKAAEKGSPDTEADKMAADAVVYEIEFAENDKRALTPQQIKATFERYRDLNYKNAQYKPVMDLVEQIMAENPGMNSKQLAETMQNIYKAQASNPTMGNTQGEKSGDYAKEGAQQAGDLEAMLSKWEEENAASLPPGYKDMLVGQNQTMAQMQQQLAQTQQMLQAVLAQSQGVADAARQGMQQGQQSQVNAVRQTIANNIDRVQQALQLPDEKAQDFMVFAAERGYTMEDFVDPQLTIKVMTDFRNNMDSPEMERMRQIAQRRQAYTGSLGSTPSAGGAAADAPAESTFERFSSAAMQRRGMA